ncbi:mycothiol acetyltransferase [mine drainage metagenome]|uniref:Mycothiol acetyltransferase n=1 Tax=mine drainage metagenome TaxID=410659 RepID=A0A1J5RS26_9ZZZZ
MPNFTRCLALPEPMTSSGIGLRAETDDDRDFVERLYLTVRWEELAQVDWPETAKTAFLKDQFLHQRHHYLTHYHDTDFGIVTWGGAPVGRLYLYRGRVDCRIVDISLLPEARGQGLGTALLGAVFAESAAAGRTVSIHVEIFNPAQRLYERLGFQDVTVRGPYRLMQWGAPSMPPTSDPTP